MDYFDEKDIAKLIKAQDSEVEAYVLRITKEIDKLLSQTVRDISPELKINELLTILSKLSSTNLPETTKQRIRESLQLYQSRVNTVREMIEQASGISAPFNQDDEALVKAIFENDVATQLTTIDETFNEFKQAVFRGVYTNGLPQLPELQANLSQRLEGKLKTQANTQLAGFQTSLTVKKADDVGLRYFKYSGNIIKTTRKFCERRAGKIFTIEEAQTWQQEQGQGLPVIPYLGGYNCRHSMVFMTEDRALKMGYKPSYGDLSDDV